MSQTEIIGKYNTEPLSPTLLPQALHSSMADGDDTIDELLVKRSILAAACSSSFNKIIMGENPNILIRAIFG